MSRNLLVASAVATAMTWLVLTSASAHHANSAYDRNQSVTVSGAVTQWQFINPHAGLWL
ncbi:MAG: hypothetical protein HKN84_03560, partial [Gammaproteobacteria bacterium]|nr:hypothetical protein [Gammaproteobacteria bacterium]